jgi:signal transduction histidine kinase
MGAIFRQMVVSVNLSGAKDRLRRKIPSMLTSRFSMKDRGLLRIAGTRIAFGVLQVSIAFGPTVLRAQSSPPKLPTLTHAEEVRRLSPEEAAKGYPVRIRGVITMDAPAPDFFVQDSTAGIYAEGSGSPRFSHSLGELVEVEGITGPGKFAPVIREHTLRTLGVGNLPQARVFAFAEIADGQQDSQWIKLRGIVRSTSIDRTSWRETTLALRVASAGGEFDVRVPVSHEQDLSSWIDNEVLIEGVCGSLYNVNRQLTGILVYVPRLSFIKVEAPSREVPLSGLLRFSAAEATRHRVRVRGIVEYQQLGHALFIQGEGKGLRVLTPQDTPVAVGDVVDVLGFPAMGESAPILQDAIFHRVDHETAPSSVPLNLNTPWEQYDGALVTTDAKLLNRIDNPDGMRLLLQRGDIIFDAALPAGTTAERLQSVPVNSEVRLTGVCLVRSGGLWRIPQSFRMLLRSPLDITVLKKPSWWNLRHTLWLLGITAGILLIVMVWMLALRRRVREQMEVIRQKLRTSAVLEERNRIARELHDTLEQELAGITLQLDLAVDSFQGAPRIAQQAVETARNMSRHSMIEARRSVWDLRCQLLENGDLVSALSQIVEPLGPRNGRIAVKIEGEHLRLPSPMEMNFLRIGQEAVANAVKHGGARSILVELRYTPEAVRLSVTDDGKGFDAAQPSRTGHFGVQDMRERAQSMGSELKIESDPNRGTTVSVEVRIDPGKTFDAEHKADTYSRG